MDDKARITGVRESEEPPSQSYDSLADDGEYPSAKALKQIELDLHRTFYTHKSLQTKGGQGQQALFNILSVYAKTNSAVG